MTVTKFFLYLVERLAIAATDTIDRRHMRQIPAVGFLYPAGRPEPLAEKLRSWLNHRNQLLAAQQTTWDGARAIFCWDVEQTKFLELIGASAYSVGRSEAGKS